MPQARLVPCGNAALCGPDRDREGAHRCGLAAPCSPVSRSLGRRRRQRRSARCDCALAAESAPSCAQRLPQALLQRPVQLHSSRRETYRARAHRNRRTHRANDPETLLLVPNTPVACGLAALGLYPQHRDALFSCPVPGERLAQRFARVRRPIARPPGHHACASRLPGRCPRSRSRRQ
eukprot:Amastigsp_a175039_14.p4 type:complete len:178 gc:universal Amastigsp_a175039_14:399-932(+)